MNKIYIYSIYDKKANIFYQPTFASNRAVAQRDFGYTMSRNSMIADDCSLYEIGSFDVESGILTAYEKPLFVQDYAVKGE